MDDLGGADGRQVAVALIGEHRLGGMGALDAGGHSGSTAVGSLLHIAVEILVGKDGAADGAHTDGLVQQAHFLQDLGYQLMYDAVVAARAVMEFGIRQALGLLIYDCHIT